MDNSTRARALKFNNDLKNNSEKNRKAREFAEDQSFIFALSLSLLFLCFAYCIAGFDVVGFLPTVRTILN